MLRKARDVNIIINYYMITLILSLLYQGLSHPSIISVQQYTKSDLRVFDDTYSVGMYDVKYNDSLYFYHPIGGTSQCFEATCAPNNITCPRCNWTDHDTCAGKSRPLNSTCPCINPPPVCFVSKFIYEYAPWSYYNNSIIVNIKHTSSIIDIPVHPNPPTNCSCIVLTLDTVEGFSGGAQIFYGETWTGSLGPYMLTRFSSNTICPNDPHWGETLIVRLILDTTVTYDMTMKVTMSYHALPGSDDYMPYEPAQRAIASQLISSVTEVGKCTPISDFQCLPTQKLTTLSPSNDHGYIKVIIQPTIRCGLLSFWSSGNEHLFSTNSNISMNNAENSLRTQRYAPYDVRMYPSLYSYCLEEDENLYVLIIGTTSIQLFADITYSWLILRPITALAPPDYQRRLLGATTLQCDTANYTTNKLHLTFGETMKSGTLSLRMVYPSDDLDLFHPSPILGTSNYRQTHSLSHKPMNPNRIVVSMFLSQRLQARIQPLKWKQPWGQNDYSWLTVSDFQKCHLHINGNLADKYGNTIRSHIKPTTSKPLCIPMEYSRVAAEISKVMDELSVLVDQSQTLSVNINTLLMVQARLLASNEFYMCKELIDNYYSIKVGVPRQVTTRKCTSDFNTPQFNDDPCCTLDDTLYSNCSLSSRLVTQHAVDRYLVDTCHTSECSKQSIDNLLVEYNILRNPASCSSDIERKNDETVYWRCIDSIWGPESIEFSGKSCAHDLDCSSGVCDVYSRRCLDRVSDMEPLLIECIYSNISTYTRNYITKELGLLGTESNIISLWFEKFVYKLSCSSDYVPVGFDVNLAVIGVCYTCGLYTPNPVTSVSVWEPSPGPNWPQFGRDCWGPGSSQCSLNQVKLTASSYCTMRGCNIMQYGNKEFFPFVVSTSYCPTDTICGISNDNYFYRNITDSVSLDDCDKSIACVLANDTVIRVHTESECENLYSCDVECNGCDMEQCLKLGSCSDSTDYDVGLWINKYSKYTAGCFFNIHYRNSFSATVDICEIPFRSTILGCSYYDITESECLAGNFSWGDNEILAIMNIRWIKRANTIDNCAAYGKICNDPNNVLPSGLPAYTNTRVFSNACPIEQVDLYKWTNARWLPGQIRYPTIITGNVSIRFNNSSRMGLDLQRILGNITSANDKLNSLKTQASAFCRIGYKTYLDQLVCSCITQNNDTECYSGSSNLSNILVLCDQVVTVNANLLKIHTTNTSLPVATCSNLFVSSTSIIHYKSKTLIPLRTILVNYAEDAEYAIRNAQNGIYGKMLTDGYSIRHNTVVSNITFCIQISIFRLDYMYFKDYPVFDLAIVNGDLVIPLGLHVNNADGYLCTNLPELQSDVVYHFIQRSAEKHTRILRTVFSRDDVAYMSVILTLYCIGLIATTIKLLMLLVNIYIKGIGYDEFRYGCILVLMVMFFAFRVVLLSLLLSNQLLSPRSTKAINYVLFEFPILLYFFFVTNYVGIWFMTVKYIERLDILPKEYDRRLYFTNYVTIVISAVLLLLFIIMIILFETIIDDPILSCGGSIMIYDTESSNNLLLAYRIIFSSVSIILGTSLFIVGWTYASILYRLSEKYSSINMHDVFKLCLLSTIGGMGLIGQAIYFLIITIAGKTPVNVVSLTILVLLETIPSLLFVFIEAVKK